MSTSTASAPATMPTTAPGRRRAVRVAKRVPAVPSMRTPALPDAVRRRPRRSPAVSRAGSVLSPARVSHGSHGVPRIASMSWKKTSPTARMSAN